LTGSVSAEFAVVLPLVAISLLLVAQVSLLVWDQLRITHAAREGARELAVGNDDERAREAALRAGDLDSERTSIEVEPAERPAGTPARVTVRYRPAVVVPMVARFVPEVELTASASMRMERDP
jgi:Flp pilus assembly protein TadG